MGSSESDKLGLDPNASASPFDESTRFPDSTEDSLNTPPHELTDSNDPGIDILPRDQQQKTATYDYAYEKFMSHAEAKLFYQHHQLTAKGADNEGSSNPVSTGESPELDWAMTGDASPQDKSETTGVSEGLSALGLSGSPRNNGADGTAQNGQEAAERSARNQAAPPVGAAHAESPFLSAGEGVNNTGLGIGMSQGAGFAPGNDAVTSELRAIYRKIKGLLDCRSKYMSLSLQRPGDDPRDQPDWSIYPPPPEPAWDDGKEYQPGNTGGPSDLTGKKRKMGENIGEDFDLDELTPFPEESSSTYRLDGNSVYQVFASEAAADRQEPIVQIPSLRDFYMDLDGVVDVSTDGPAKSFSFKRLSYLEGKFQLYSLLNEYQEIADSKKVPHRDFYNVRKVDTHVHHSACMNQKHLLRFIKSKMRKSPDEVVLFRDGKHLTLREVFESINLTAYDLSIDTLDMHVSLLLLFPWGFRMDWSSPSLPGAYRFLPSVRQIQPQV